DTSFTSNLKCRWIELRQNIFSNAAINAYIDTTVSLLSEAQVRHFTKWPILGVYTWPNPSPIPTSFAGEISALKAWIQARLSWMDANMPGFNNIPTVNLGHDTAFCPNQIILNAGNAGSSYLWSTGDTSQTITVHLSGIYSVLVNRNGCKNRDTIVVTIKPVTDVFAGNDTTICQGNPITLNATEAVSYNWSDGVAQGVSFVPTSTHQYIVTAHGANECINKDSILVTVIPLPSKPIVSVVYAAMDTLISNAAMGNQWYKNGIIVMGENGPRLVVSSLVTGTYTDIVTLNGCSSVPSDAVNLYAGIENQKPNLSFEVYPNPFTDQTSISYNLQYARHVLISIYDITGRTIKVLSNSWQEMGEHRLSFDATTLQSGVYYYCIKAGEDIYTAKIVKLDNH
ncbi:MAG: T9SS type A sorting domain-containing protein, partial [Bacteroidota bacterium]